MPGKRGGTHVGFVLSFIIFVTFLTFLYSIIIEPVTNQHDKQFILENLRINLAGQFSISNFTIKTLIITIAEGALGSKECIRINENEGTIKKGGLADLFNQGINFTIKDSSDNVLNFSEQGPNNLNIGPINSSFDGFLKVYYAEQFERSPEYTGPSNCFVVRPEDYEITYEISNKKIYEKKIIDLISEYENNYEELKEELGVPTGSDFWFSFEYNNGTIIGPEEIIPSVNVYATEFPIQYVDESANVLIGILRIKVW